MQLVCSVLVLYCIVKVYSLQNNVCPTFDDYYTLRENSNCWYDVAAESNGIDIIKSYGYPVELHKVKTDDGYILGLIRIPNKNVSNARENPVFLQHAWLFSGASFVGLGNQSLGLTLAEAGYDVWLGNFRGTEYSEGHEILSVYNKKYWNVSVDDLGLYDIPAQLNYVAQVTGKKGKIVYIGHSLGSAAALIYGSTFPKEAKDTVKLFIHMGPSRSLIYTKSLFFRSVAPFMISLLKIVNSNDLIRILSQAETMKNLTRILCLESPLLMQRCVQVSNFVLLGPQAEIDPSVVPIFFNQVPAGCSLKILKQITDWVEDKLRKYDYGILNKKVYGTLTSPLYDVSKIQVPTFIIYSMNDWTTTEKDALLLFRDLSPEVKKYGIYRISQPQLNHIDYVYSKRSKGVIYDKILSVLQSL